VDERRANARRTVKVSARVAAAPEQRLPRADTVDISRSGVLLAFDEPVGFPAMHRLVISLELPDGHFHALGHVTRVERGDDFRTYMAMSFVHVSEDEFDELLSRLDTLDHDRPLPLAVHGG
jgi:hypothetical protein